MSSQTPTTSSAPLSTSALARLRARRASGTRLVVIGLVVLVLGAVAPVLAQSSALAGISSVLWVASMPLCLAGAGLVAAGVMRRRSARGAADEDWG